MTLAFNAADPTVIDRLSDWQIAEFAPPMPTWNKYIPHIPTMRQLAFLLLEHESEVLYGGAAAGGKSDALLMAALQFVHYPNYSALLLRRTYADLERPGALIPRSHEWLRGTDAHWNGRRWRFPSGATLDFGYLDNENDKYNYQSSEYHFIGFDELTQFKESWYKYLFSRRRRHRDSPIPTRVRAATNPGGIGHDWVHQRFIVEGRKKGRWFIPARLSDNPHVDEDDYRAALAMLDPVTRAQLEHGDWSIRQPGIFFDRRRFTVVPSTHVPSGLEWIRMWDLAATKNQTSAYTAGAKVAMERGRMWIADIRRIKGDPFEVESLIRDTAELDGRDVTVWIEREPGSGGINTTWRYRYEVLQGFAFEEYQPKHDKLTRAAPLSALHKAGGVTLVEGDYVDDFLDEADMWPNGYRDQIDTLSASLQVLSQRPSYRIRSL